MAGPHSSFGIKFQAEGAVSGMEVENGLLSENGSQGSMHGLGGEGDQDGEGVAQQNAVSHGPAVLGGAAALRAVQEWVVDSVSVDFQLVLACYCG